MGYIVQESPGTKNLCGHKQQAKLFVHKPSNIYHDGATMPRTYALFLVGVILILLMRWTWSDTADECAQCLADYGPPPSMSGKNQRQTFDGSGLRPSQWKITSSTPIPTREEMEALGKYWSNVLLGKKLLYGANTTSKVDI